MELMTKTEKEQLEARLASLMANRPVLSQRIEEARALGDLRENGDYHAAREQQGMEEAEIRRLEQRIASVTVIDEKLSKAVEGVAFIGSTVKLKELDSGDIELYKLVGESSGQDTGDVTEVTVNSPMGEALLKARVGDVVRVNARRGVLKFEILEVS